MCGHTELQTPKENLPWQLSVVYLERIDATSEARGAMDVQARLQRSSESKAGQQEPSAVGWCAEQRQTAGLWGGWKMLLLLALSLDISLNWNSA